VEPANAIPLELLKAKQDRIGVAERAATRELDATEGDLEGWQDVPEQPSASPATVMRLS
jgi:hypothetical protein